MGRTRSAGRAVAVVAVALLATLPPGLPTFGEEAKECDRRPAIPPQRPRPDPAEAALTPGNVVLHLKRGETRTVRYRLVLPPRPTPLDVFFLVDTTESMERTICGLRLGLFQIAQGLRDSGIDARFGLGEFKDYPLEDWGTAGLGDEAYRLRRSIGPLDASFVDAIMRLDDRGGGDFPEAALAAMYQAATGAGEDVHPPGDTPGDIPRGQDAGFRPGSLRVIVAATDASFHTRGNGYPGPSWDDTLAALLRRGILLVGIAPPPRLRPPVSHDSRADLQRAARGTGALAPAGGLDCDGDGRVEVGPGGPLVCAFEEDPQIVVLGRAPRLRIGSAVLGLLRDLRDEASVRLVPEGRNSIIRSVSGGRAVDLVRGAEVEFSVVYSCPKGLSSEGRARVAARVRDATVGAAEVLVRCPAAAAVLVGGPPAAVPAQPAPAPAGRTVSNTTGQTEVAPAPRPNPAAGLAAAPQEQPQLAFRQALDEAAGDGPSMSRRRDSEAVAIVRILAALATLGFALALGAQRAQHARAVGGRPDPWRR